MALAGSLRQVALPEVLRSIESGQRTGRLNIERGPLRAAIYFSGGQWLLLERSGDSAPIAHHLAHSGLITPQQFQAATGGISIAQAGIMPDLQSIRMLISARIITQEQLRAWFQQDAVGLLTVLMGWPDGEFGFEEGVQVPPGRVALPLPVTPLLGQAVQSLRGGGLSLEVVPLSPDTVIDFAEIDPRTTSSIHITHEQWRLLTQVDGQMPLWAVAQNLQAPEHIILQLAGELTSMGIVFVVGSVASASAQPFA
jgi:hypothetical protein